MSTQTQFFTELCRDKFGWEPTPWRLAAFTYWANHEYSDTDGNGNNQLFDAGFNPLATTRQGDNLHYNYGFDIGYGPGNWNHVPVKVYADYASGLQATYETLQLGYYVNVRKCFADQTGYQAAVKPYDFFSWVGSEAYGQDVVNFMNSTTASKTMGTSAPMFDASTVAMIVEAFGGLQALKDWNANGNALFLGYAIEQAKQAALADLVSRLVPPVDPVRAVRDALTKALP